MKDTDPVQFFTHDEISGKADAIFSEEKALLGALLPEADIQHVGSSAIPGALTKFDIDIQIRVEISQFDKVVEIMKNNFLLKHRELWTNEFAIFKNKNEFPIDYMITVIDSKYDDFYRVRDFLTTHPDILQKYNEMKNKHQGKPYDEYRKAKKEFLGSNGSTRFLKY